MNFNVRKSVYSEACIDSDVRIFFFNDKKKVCQMFCEVILKKTDVE